MLKHVLKRGVSRVETEVDPRRKYLLARDARTNIFASCNGYICKFLAFKAAAACSREACEAFCRLRCRGELAGGNGDWMHKGRRQIQTQTKQTNTKTNTKTNTRTIDRPLM